MQRSVVVVLALAVCVLPVQAYVQRDKTQQAPKGEMPSLPVALGLPQRSDNPPLQPETDRHIGADVRVISSPAKDGYDKAAFWINFALALVGMSGVAIGVFTVLFIKAQVVEMRRQRITMDRTLIAMRKQIRVSEETAKTQLRAYMTYRQGRVFVTDGKPVRISIELENTGQTPAYSVNGAYVGGFDQRPVPKPGGDRSTAIVGAGKSFVLNVPMNGWDEGTIATLSRGGRYYVTGKFSYFDIFREKERNLSFQIFIGATISPIVLEEEGGKFFYRFSTDSVGNEAD